MRVTACCKLWWRYSKPAAPTRTTLYLWEKKGKKKKGPFQLSLRSSCISVVRGDSVQKAVVARMQQRRCIQVRRP